MLRIPRFMKIPLLAGVSAFKVYAIAFVVGSVVFRSLGTLQAPGYSWEGVASFDWSQHLFATLPILAFGFQVRGQREAGPEVVSCGFGLETALYSPARAEAGTPRALTCLASPHSHCCSATRRLWMCGRSWRMSLRCCRAPKPPAAAVAEWPGLGSLAAAPPQSCEAWRAWL